LTAVTANIPFETDRHFKRTNLSAEEPVAGVKRGWSVATGCSARLWWHVGTGAGADAKGVARGQAVGDEGDDPHLGAAERAAEWEDLIEAGQQQRPGVAGRPAMGRFGGGFWMGCGRRGRCCQREGGDCSAQR
jgi:hypothetical protein